MIDTESLRIKLEAAKEEKSEVFDLMYVNIWDLMRDFDKLKLINAQLVEAFENHYWDSLTKDKDMIMLHIKAILFPAKGEQPCPACEGSEEVKSIHPHDIAYYGDRRPCPDCKFIGRQVGNE